MFLPWFSSPKLYKLDSICLPSCFQGCFFFPSLKAFSFHFIFSSLSVSSSTSFFLSHHRDRKSVFLLRVLCATHTHTHLLCVLASQLNSTFSLSLSPLPASLSLDLEVNTDLHSLPVLLSSRSSKQFEKLIWID